MFGRRCKTMVIAALVMAAWAPPAAGAATKTKPVEQHCALQVIGESVDGELLTGPLECDSADSTSLAMTASSGVIAKHFTGFNYTGSELDILGTSCTGGWLNMPAGWTNVIASTQSFCTVVHYDLYYLQGSNATTYSPGNNLYNFYARTNSAQYF